MGDQLSSAMKIKKPHDPGNAALNLLFAKVQPVADITISQSLTHQSVDRTEGPGFLPEDAHGDPTSLR